MVGVVHCWNDDNERLGYSGELPAGVVMMKHEERDSLTGIAFNFRHEHVEGEMRDAWLFPLMPGNPSAGESP